MVHVEYPAFVAEFIATFTLVFIGAGSILMDGSTGGKLGLGGIALAHGLALLVMIYAIGHVSGGHVNPAVSFSMWLTGRMPAAKTAGYVVSQLGGAVVGAAALATLFPGAANFGVPALAASVSVWQAVLLEAIATFFLVFVIFGTAVETRAPKGVYGAAIGLTVAADILAIGPLTGAAMNPARAFGPALLSGLWASHVVYWAGPLLGAAAAALVYSKVILKTTSK